MEWRSDFSNSFLGQGESCSYAPLILVDGDQLTGWAEGDEGDGVGVDVVVPQLLDLTQPVRIWAGYGKSPRTLRRERETQAGTGDRAALARGGAGSA